MRPKLVATIELRRLHAAAKFHDRRRLQRRGEMKNRFSSFRPQLSNITRHQLFLDADLLELPVVKELVEENDCRVPLTDERWLTVQSGLVEAVKDHAQKIEDDCARTIRAAKDEAFKSAMERWFEKEIKKWKERQDEWKVQRRAEGMDEEEIDEGDPDDPFPVHYKPPEVEEVEEPYYFDNDYDSHQSIQADEDRMPSCLLSAISLFEEKRGGANGLTSYAEILRGRTLRPYLSTSFTSVFLSTLV